MEYREMLHRYVGRRVCVSTFGHSKLWGQLAAVNEDCLRLVNTTLSTDGDDQWSSQNYSDPDSNFGVRHAETIVHFHHIVAITCLDDDLSEPNDGLSQLEESDAATSQSGQRVIADDVFHHLRLERLEVLIGHGLIRLADPKTLGGLADRIISLRNLMGAQLGFVLPPARMRDDSRLALDEYRIFVNGTEAARGFVRPNKLLAVTVNHESPPLEGERTLEPVFAQPAVWIEPSQQAAAERAGHAVIEPAAVLVTHLQNEARRHAHELFSIDGLRMLLDHLRQSSPAVVDELVPGRVSLSRLHDLLCRLLEEEVPLRPLERILERVAHLPPGSDDLEQTLSVLRASLGRILCDRFRDGAGRLPLVSLDRELNDRLDEAILGEADETGLWLARFSDGLRMWHLDRRGEGRDLPLVVDTSVRRRLRQLIAPQIPSLAVLAFAEIPHDLPVELVTVLSERDLGLQRRSTRSRRRKEQPAATMPEPPRRAPR